MSARISIAMATCNGERFLAAQLQSFLAQTLLPDELVVSDDGSADDTLAVVEEFARRAPFTVRILANEDRLGYARNFARALAQCDGDIIFLSDQDDVWFADKLATMADRLAADGRLQVLQADMVLTDVALQPTSFTQLGNILALGQGSERFITGCGTALRREWLELVLPLPGGLDSGHDDWIHRLAIALDVRGLVARPLQYYRRHDHNSSGWLASKPARLTPIDSLLAHGLEDASAGWRAENQRVRAAAERIEVNTAVLHKLGIADRHAGALQRLRVRESAYDRRLEAVASGRLQRLPRLLRCWAGGGYDEFSGWKSALKDLLR